MQKNQLGPFRQPSITILALLALFAVAVLPACDAGLIEVEYTWPDGMRPTYPEGTHPTATLRVEERTDPRVPGREITPSVSEPFSEGHIHIPLIPYGTNRVFVLEIRPSPDGDVDWYGLSEPFSNARGEHKKIPVLMGPVHPPQIVPSDRGETIEVVTATIAPGIVSRENVELILTADVQAIQARISNISGVPDRRSFAVDLRGLEPFGEAPDGFKKYKVRWNLGRDLDAPCKGKDYCLRQVHARFTDAQGYRSLPATATVILDEAVPTVVPSLTSVAPLVARAGQTLEVHVAASEVVRPPVVQLRGKKGFRFKQISPPPGTETLGASYTFASVETVDALGLSPPPRLDVLVDLSDLVGNTARGLEIGSFSIDTAAPVITDLTITPSQINSDPERKVEVSFTISKSVDHDAYQVRIGQRAMDDCQDTPSAGRLHVRCERRMRGDEIPADTEHTETVSVDVEDAAGNTDRATGTVVFDFRPPTLYAAAITPPTARMGDAAQIYIAASEPLAPEFVPELTFNNAHAPPFEHQPQRDSSFERYYTLVVRPGLEEQRYDLSALRLVDAAGNISRVVAKNQGAPGAASEGAAELESDLLPLSWLVDTTPPVVDALTLEVEDRPDLDPPRVPKFAGTRVNVDFVERELNPKGMRVLIGAQELNPAQDCTHRDDEAAATRQWHCTWTSTGEEYSLGVEASTSVVVELEDLAGHASTRSMPIIFDYRMPDIVPGSISLQLIPALDNPLRLIPGPFVPPAAMTTGTTALIAFAVDEPLQEAPVVVALESGLSFALERGSGPSYAFQHTLILSSDNLAFQGEDRINVDLVDAAGNRIQRTLTLPEPGLVIDTEPPPPPDTLRITHERFPWGSDATGNGEHAFVRGAEDAAAPSSYVLVVDRPDLHAASVLGASTSEPDGSIVRFELDRREDRPSVYVAVLDAAGNGSAGTTGAPREARRVQKGEWTASLRGKIPNTDRPNPHDALKIVGRVSPTLQQPPEEIEPLTGGSWLGTNEFAALAEGDGAPLVVSGAQAWRSITPSGVHPSAREKAAFAYDVERGRAVLFGGYGVRTDGSIGFLDDTWEWDGYHWAQILPTGPHPSERASAVMGYHRWLGAMVLTGGRNGSSQGMEDTWLWDGTNWTPHRPTTPIITGGQQPVRPGIGSGSALYDRRAGTLTLVSTDDTRFAEFWSWSSAGWFENVQLDRLPSRRDASAIQTPNGLLYFGGLDNHSIESNALWRCASPQPCTAIHWGDITYPATQTPDPSPRQGAVFAYDEIRNQVLLFGGEAASNSRPVLLSDTWTDEQQLGVGSPSARAFAASTFDASLGKIVMFGGRGEDDAQGEPTYLDDTWAWDGEAWQDLSPSSAAPSIRYDHAMAYDPIKKEVVMFGGVHYAPDQTETFLDDTWSWNGHRWHLREAPQNPQYWWPSPRRGAAMTSSPEEYGVLMFGGLNEASENIRGRIDRFCRLRSPYDEWINLDDAEPTCSDEAVVGGECSYGVEYYYFPSPRSGHAMATDLDTKKVFLFGGTSDGYFGGMTTPGIVDFHLYEWSLHQPVPGDFDGWNVLDPSSGPTPSPRTEHAMTFDRRRSRLVLFGGSSVEAGGDADDLWEWDGQSWTNVPTSGDWPEARQSHALIYDTNTGISVLAGGIQSNTDIAFDDVWTWDGQQWTRVAARQGLSPGARGGLAMAYDEQRERLVVFGGRGPGADSATWERGSQASATPGVILSFDWSEAQVAEESIAHLQLRGVAGAEAHTVGAKLALWNARLGAWVPMMTNLADSTAPRPIAKEIVNSFSAYIDHNQKLNMLFAPRDGGSQFNAEPATSIEGVELRVDYSHEE